VFGKRAQGPSGDMRAPSPGRGAGGRAGGQQVQNTSHLITAAASHIVPAGLDLAHACAVGLITGWCGMGTAGCSTRQQQCRKMGWVWAAPAQQNTRILQRKTAQRAPASMCSVAQQHIAAAAAALRPLWRTLLLCSSATLAVLLCTQGRGGGAGSGSFGGGTAEAGGGWRDTGACGLRALAPDAEPCTEPCAS
jgi:hypothetical protein